MYICAYVAVLCLFRWFYAFGLLLVAPHTGLLVRHAKKMYKYPVKDLDIMGHFEMIQMYVC